MESKTGQTDQPTAVNPDAPLEPISTKSDGLQKFESLRVTTGMLIDEPEPVVSINRQVIATRGNILTISGPPKGGKSAFSSVLLAGAISQDGNVEGFEGVTVLPNPEKKAVIHFDTEMAVHKHLHTIRTILWRNGLEESPDYLLSYNLRSLDQKEYEEVVAAICAAADERYGGIHMIVIDGLADFVKDVNDPEASNKVVRSTELLAHRYKTVVLPIVHTNPGTDKERGHLGSQLQRKAESVLMIKQQGGISHMEPKLLRLASKEDVPSIQFVFDKAKGYHVSCSTHSGTQLEEKLFMLRALSFSVFAGQQGYKYRDAVDQIMKYTGKGERLSKNLFRECKAHELIRKNNDDLWYLATDKQNEEVEESL